MISFFKFNNIYNNNNRFIKLTLDMNKFSFFKDMNVFNGNKILQLDINKNYISQPVTRYVQIRENVLYTLAYNYSYQSIEFYFDNKIVQNTLYIDVNSKSYNNINNDNLFITLYDNNNNVIHSVVHYISTKASYRFEIYDTGMYHIGVYVSCTHSTTTPIANISFKLLKGKPSNINTTVIKNIFTNDKMINLFINNKLYPIKYIIHGTENLFDFVANNTDLKLLYDTIIEQPNNVEMNYNNNYMFILDELRNRVPIVDEIQYNDINTGDITLIDFDEESILNIDMKVNVEYVDNYIIYEQSIFKDLLFTYVDSNDFAQYCDILFDSTTIYSDILIGSTEQVNLNTYFTVFKDTNRIFFKLKYNKDIENVEDEVIYDIYTDYKYNFNTTNKLLLNSITCKAILGTNDVNSLIIDKFSDADKIVNKNIYFNRGSIDGSYKKYIDLIDYKYLRDNTAINTNINIDYTTIGITDDIINEIVFSKNGFFNKDNEVIYSIVNFIDNNDLSIKTICLKLLFNDLLNKYTIIKSIKLPFSFNNIIINDIILYENDIFYIETISRDLENIQNNNLLFGTGVIVDINNNKIQFQALSNFLKIYNYYNSLMVAPAKSRNNNQYKMSPIIALNYYYNKKLDNYIIVDNTSTELEQIKFYRYSWLTNKFNTIENKFLYINNVPYDDLYLVDDKSYILIDLNVDEVVYNKNNFNFNLITNDQCILNNFGFTQRIDNPDTILKIFNEFYNIYDLDVDNYNITTNIKQNMTNNEYDIINDNFGIIESQLDDIRIILDYIHDYCAIFLMKQKSDSTLWAEYNYPTNIILYKKINSSEFEMYASHILNDFTIDNINKYYYIDRLLLNDKYTQQVYFQK